MAHSRENAGSEQHEEGGRRKTSSARIALLAASALAAVAAIWALPRIAQDPTYHLFADNRTLLGIPNALNVLSNVVFAIVGLAGTRLVLRGEVEMRDTRERWPWLVFFAGVVLTSLGSAW
jgi:uncharacterized membrane protein YqjE